MKRKKKNTEKEDEEEQSLSGTFEKIFYLFGSTFQGERGCSLFKPFDSSPTAEMCVLVRAARWLLLLRVRSVCRAVFFRWSNLGRQQLVVNTLVNSLFRDQIIC